MLRKGQEAQWAVALLEHTEEPDFKCGGRSNTGHLISDFSVCSNSDTAHCIVALFEMCKHQVMGQAYSPRLQQNFQALWLADEVKAVTAATTLTESGY